MGGHLAEATGRTWPSHPALSQGDIDRCFGPGLLDLPGDSRLTKSCSVITNCRPPPHRAQSLAGFASMASGAQAQGKEWPLGPATGIVSLALSQMHLGAVTLKDTREASDLGDFRGQEGGCPWLTPAAGSGSFVDEAQCFWDEVLASCLSVTPGKCTEKLTQSFPSLGHNSQHHNLKEERFYC